MRQLRIVEEPFFSCPAKSGPCMYEQVPGNFKLEMEGDLIDTDEPIKPKLTLRMHQHDEAEAVEEGENAKTEDLVRSHQKMFSEWMEWISTPVSSRRPQLQTSTWDIEITFKKSDSRIFFLIDFGMQSGNLAVAGLSTTTAPFRVKSKKMKQNDDMARNPTPNSLIEHLRHIGPSYADKITDVFGITSIGELAQRFGNMNDEQLQQVVDKIKTAKGRMNVSRLKEVIEQANHIRDRAMEQQE